MSIMMSSKTLDEFLGQLNELKQENEALKQENEQLWRAFWNQVRDLYRKQDAIDSFQKAYYEQAESVECLEEDKANLQMECDCLSMQLTAKKMEIRNLLKVGASLAEMVAAYKRQLSAAEEMIQEQAQEIENFQQSEEDAYCVDREIAVDETKTRLLEGPRPLYDFTE